MSSVPKGKQKPHDFVASHNLRELRKKVTELAVNDFGYDKERLEEKIRKFEDSLTNANVDPERKEQIVARMRAKNESYYTDFVEDETKETRWIIRRVVWEFEIGNSIHPTGDARFMEYCERRKHLDNAIGWLFCLKQELQYIAETLPGDKNRFESLTRDFDPEDKDKSGEIEKEIALIKGVRRASNKYLGSRPRPRARPKTPNREALEKISKHHEILSK